MSSVSVECLEDRLDWEFLKICKCKVLSSSDKRIQSESIAWVAVKNDFGRMKNVGDKVKFWEVEVWEGVVFGTDRFEDILDGNEVEI